MAFLSYIATALVLFGVYFISKPRRRGQYFMVAAECSWLLYALLTHQWALAVQSLVLLKFALAAIKNWRKEGILV